MSAGRADLIRRFAKLREKPGNDKCAECHAADTSWVVLDYGVFICVRCAGAHRGLGTHISKVRSTQHDQFTPSELEWIDSLGNAKSAALYEAALPSTMRRPTIDSPEVIRRTWLRLKYDELCFTAGQDAREQPHERLKGQLQKQGSFVPVWRRRHFCVRSGLLLCYFTDETESEAAFRGVLPLAGCSVQLDPDDPFALRLRTQRPPSSASARASVKDSSKSMALRAPSIEAAEAWAWAFFQCAHGAAARAAESPQLAGIAQLTSRRQKSSTLFHAAAAVPGIERSPASRVGAETGERAVTVVVGP